MITDSNTLITFFLGAISTIVISVIANLITPDRQSIINFFKNWYGKLSKERAAARVKSLKEELDGISDGIAFPDKVAMLFREVMTLTVRDLGFAGFALILSFFDQGFLAKYLFILLGAWMFMRINQRATKLANIFAKINDFDKYKSETEALIKKFERIAQTEKVNDETKMG